MPNTGKERTKFVEERTAPTMQKCEPGIKLGERLAAFPGLSQMWVDRGQDVGWVA